MDKSATFNKKSDYTLNNPNGDTDSFLSFIEHIAEHYPVASLALARELLTTDTVFTSKFDKEIEQGNGIHLLLRITENHPLLALPLAINVIVHNKWPNTSDGISTAISHCAKVYPKETSELLKKTIVDCRHGNIIRGRLYSYLQETGYDLNTEQKIKFELI